MSTRPIGAGPGSSLAAPTLSKEERAALKPRKLRRLLPYFRPYWRKATVSVLLMLVVTAAGLAIPALAKVAIDDGVIAGNKSVLYVTIGIFIGVGAVALVAGYYQNYLSRWVGERVLLDLRTDTYRHAMGLELGYHERVPAGHTVSRLTSDIEALTQLVTDGFSSLVVNGLTLIGVVVILFVFDWQLALLVFVIFPPLAIATAAFRHYSTIAYRRTRERVADVLANLQESMSGMRVVQGFARQDAAAVEFFEVNERYRRANRATIRLSALYFPGVEMLAGIGTAVILYFGSSRVLDGELTLGVMIAFIGYLSSFFDPVQQLSQLYNTFQAAMAALDKILGVLETRPDLEDAPDAVALPEIRGAVELRRVGFGYGETPVLHDVDLSISAGQTVALVGATGAGKSTLAKLVVRFYDPTDGEILIDGVDLRGTTLASLRDQIAIVPQEGYLFAGTIADNLRFGDPSASDDALRAALEAVGGAEFVGALPNGLETELRERGTSLSVGQRQLIAFARALVSDPRLLVLDEATSSVDLRTEARIENALATLLAGRTAIVIAHRLSTIRRADLIVVLKDGRIVEQGRHDELVRRGGHYATLHGDWDAAT